jgi:D-alanyl-D-alanine carboxypeptidase/D-alanyl-D-alanine-endopeptidase (penicillin-binding protein 4)
MRLIFSLLALLLATLIYSTGEVPAAANAAAEPPQAERATPLPVAHAATRPQPPLATAPPRPVEPEVLALRSDLEGVIRSTGWRTARWSVLAVSLDRGDTLFAFAPDQALAPASNMKLLTTAAALYYLGPQFRYSTFLMTGGRVERGVLNGDLVIYGTGDPTLSDRFFGSKTAVWEALADSLLAQGIEAIHGDVVGDASYFSGRATGLGWQESYVNASYAALASALSFNDNIVTLRILPGEQVNWRPRVQLIPGGNGIAIVNQATTRAGRSRIDVGRVGYAGPIVLRGQLAPGNRDVWRAVPVPDPARYSAAVLREVLERRGIRITGGVRSVLREEESLVGRRSVFAPAFDGEAALRVLAVHQSPPLQSILEVTNKKSHNLYAEQVLRTVGRVAVGEGTVEGGVRAVRYMLECETGADDADLADLVIDDGSGLSVLNRVSAGDMVRLLSYMARSPMWLAYWETLPEAGAPDGLRRMQRTAAERNLRAKTGTIDHVSALSGYVRAANGERLAFSIISNDVPSTWRAKRVEDAIGARLAAFRRSSGGRVVVTPVAAQTATPAAPAALDSAAAASASDARRTYRIRRGDTLEGIAKRLGLDVRALLDANPGIDPRRLMPGQVIRLP